jgi:hypothetical protein
MHRESFLAAENRQVAVIWIKKKSILFQISFQYLDKPHSQARTQTLQPAQG